MMLLIHLVTSILQRSFALMKAEIITIGNEILIGQVVDTNSAWMGQELNKLGIDVVQITSIGDDPEQLIQAIHEAKMRARIILLTGGLGPTRDDLTKKTLAAYYNCGYKRDEQTLNHIKEILSRRNIALKQNNIEQADVPEVCEVMFNANGTAPGMWFEDGEYLLASMPGVPYEMKGLMESFVLPCLAERFHLAPVLHRTFLTVNVPESELSYQLEAFEDELPDGVSLAYLPHMNTVRLRLSSRGKDTSETERALQEQSTKLQQILGDAVVGAEGKPMNEVIMDMLIRSGMSIATAESCTGGYLAHLITSIPGSSQVYHGSVIAYANEVKINELGVDPEIIRQHGAVSEACVRAMVEGVCRKMKVRAGIATSGIAGPGGGSPEKPVGTVWIAVKVDEEIICHKAQFHGGRLPIIERSSLKAFEMLWKILIRRNTSA